MVMCDKKTLTLVTLFLSKFLFITFFIQKFGSAFLSGIGIYGEKRDAGTETYQK